MNQRAIVAVILACAGCTTRDVAGIAFPRYDPQPGVPAALNEGTLIESDGCIVLEGATTWVLLWPRQYGLIRDGGRLAVVDGARVLVEVGSEVVVSGGEITSRADARSISDGLSMQCGAPFWQVTGIEEGSLPFRD